jgi:energy-converting hydrogenase B subunit M
MIRVYRVNTGSCGACDIEICSAIRANTAAKNIDWATTPQDADVLLLTGPITHGSRAPFLKLLQDVGDIPLLAIGRCSIDGYPFGRGGIQAFEHVRARVHLDGCPPTPEAILEAIQSL